MKLTICYVTGRYQPRWEWFCDALVNQVPAELWPEIEVIFIDGCLWAKGVHEPLIGSSDVPFADRSFHDVIRRIELEAAVGGRFKFVHVPPKPCAMQGPFRKTSRDFFCASNTRNTGFIVARSPYVVFIDDLTLPMPLWFNQAWHAANNGYVVAGMYKKVLQLEVERGRLLACKEFPPGVDSRWASGSDGGILPWSGSGIYGCSFGVPLELALRVDGFEPACNGSGLEDCDFGIRIERAGGRVMLNRNMLTLESEEDHHTQGFKHVGRQRKLVSPDRLPAGYDNYSMPNEAEKYFSDHVLLNRVRNETSRIVPTLPENLAVIRAEYQATGLVPIPTTETDWRDGTPLKDL